MTDPIADLLTRIRNALSVRKDTVSVPYSKIKADIVDTLVKEGYLTGVSIDQQSFPHRLIITLRYFDDQPAITRLDRISKPGRRIYLQAKDIQPVLSGQGLNILSTNQGVMTGAQARQTKLGGEIICKVW